MRSLSIVLLAVTAARAAAGPATIDLDKDDEGAWRLAEAAGACSKGQPAFIATWCNRKDPVTARFARRFAVTAREVTPGILGVSLPVTQLGKGLISSIVTPPIYCDADACLPAESLSVFVRTKTKVSAADVRALAVTFGVGGMWRARQWWGPTVKELDIKLLDATGKQIGEGTLLVAARTD